MAEFDPNQVVTVIQSVCLRDAMQGARWLDEYEELPIVLVQFLASLRQGVGLAVGKALIETKESS